MGTVSELRKKAVEETKDLPWVMWIAAMICPFGMIVVGAWIVGRSAYEHRKKNTKL